MKLEKLLIGKRSSSLLGSTEPVSLLRGQGLAIPLTIAGLPPDGIGSWFWSATIFSVDVLKTNLVVRYGKYLTRTIYSLTIMDNLAFIIGGFLIDRATTNFFESSLDDVARLKSVITVTNTIGSSIFFFHVTLFLVITITLKYLIVMHLKDSKELETSSSSVKSAVHSRTSKADQIRLIGIQPANMQKHLNEVLMLTSQFLNILAMDVAVAEHVNPLRFAMIKPLHLLSLTVESINVMPCILGDRYKALAIAYYKGDSAFDQPPLSSPDVDCLNYLNSTFQIWTTALSVLMLILIVTSASIVRYKFSRLLRERFDIKQTGIVKGTEINLMLQGPALKETMELLQALCRTKTFHRIQELGMIQNMVPPGSKRQHKLAENAA
ncbi:hypothetical protein HDU97_010252 [Phlyctochytrium planicorne]|nr:hypothetical protein HDU97_010252 [Phlyctochytrium planicorne]